MAALPLGLVQVVATVVAVVTGRSAAGSLLPWGQVLSGHGLVVQALVAGGQAWAEGWAAGQVVVVRPTEVSLCQRGQGELETRTVTSLPLLYCRVNISEDMFWLAN